MIRCKFVVVSGLPGSGKSTLGRSIAQELALPLIDKDDILEALFDGKDAGDARRRRALSRESDRLLQERASALDGATDIQDILDRQRRFDDVAGSIAALAALGPLSLEPMIDADTTRPLDVHGLARQIQALLSIPGGLAE